MTARPDTWMPFYVGDYLRKTMHLTAEQHGAYMLLLMACWVNGGTIADDDEQLSAITRLTLPKWRKMRPTIVPFFQITEAVWHNKRVTEELSKAIDISDRARAAGEASAEARRQRNVNGRATGVQQNANQTSTESQRKANETSTDPPTESQPTPQPKASTSPSPSQALLRKATAPLRGAKRAREGARDSALTRERDKIFAKGLKLLGSQYRPLIAKMLENRGQTVVIKALNDIDLTNPDEPSKAFARLCAEPETPTHRGPDGPPPTPAELGWENPP